MSLTPIVPGRSTSLAQIPKAGFEEFCSDVLAGQRVSALFAREAGKAVELFAVLANDAEGSLGAVRTEVEGEFDSLTPDCPQVHLFEREIAEQFGVKPKGHPWLKPVRKITGVDFYRVEGDEVHEVAVGPVHAGVIEPGHFRFQCHGEEVFHLEIALGYQHRGIERALIGGPNKRTIHYMETAAGDTSIGHATAYCEIVESLARCGVSPRAQVLRGIALELERLANHCGDLGALANDVGFLPTASYCGRIRGDYLNMSAALCGSRFGRGFVRPGGVGFDVDDAKVEALRKRLDAAEKDTKVAVELLWNAPSVMARFEETGPVPRDVAVRLGLVGPAARACGVEVDTRHDHPTGIYRFAHLPVSSWPSGDVFARAYVRWLEIQRSIVFIRERLETMPAGPARAEVGRLEPDRIAVSLVEGWRGEVCHVALTDGEGKFARYKMVDPSFHNWTGLAYALRNQQISDFPLCNKSFNLSYCGFDL